MRPYQLKRFIALASCAVWLSLCSGPTTLHADILQKILIMPGPVIEMHAEFETTCKNCHAPLSDIAQRELCTTCHKDVGADIKRKRGFHGRDPQARVDECASCHTDHEGRGAQTVVFDSSSFDHTLTDFPLFGLHAETSCSACHDDGTPYRNAPANCVACHQQDDRHDGALGEACSDCHNSTNWSFVRFDHTTTSFPLTGGHTSTTCVACHKTPDYAATPSDCVACHRDVDVHQGRNGNSCGDCHVTANWTRITFNHTKLTGFTLSLGHDGLTCQDCHRADDFTDVSDANCNTCHVDDDVHRGANGTECDSCHTVSNWSVTTFDHVAASRFALEGAHATVPCAACHASNVYDPQPRDCSGCHGDGDPHDGQLGLGCESCHAQMSWTGQVRFDHDLTQFPLIGSHADVACDQCHASSAFHDAAENCSDCHRDDEPHRGALGLQCEACHNPRAWQAWVFDHDGQTEFPITGAHADLTCGACHKAAQNEPGNFQTPQDCGSCHRRDDPHLGRFGNDCGSCHTTSSFRQSEAL